MRVIDYGRYMPYERPYYVITICIIKAYYDRELLR